MFTPEQIEMLKAPLDQDRVAKRKGAGGMTLSYIEGYDAIDRMNLIFGFDGWTHEIVENKILYMKEEGDGMAVFGATCVITVLIHPMVVHSDVGIGTARKLTADGIELAYKEAATDALKRAVRALGNQFGNSLYDKDSPLHNDGSSPSTSKPKTTVKTTPKPQTAAPSGEFAPNLRNNVPLSDLPAPNGKDGEYACDECGKSINNSPKYLASEIAYMSIAADGEVLCWNCKQDKTKAAA